MDQIANISASPDYVCLEAEAEDNLTSNDENVDDVRATRVRLRCENAGEFGYACCLLDVIKALIQLLSIQRY